MKWIACMFHITLDEFDYIESTLLEYDIQGYLIGHESEPYSHYHLLFQGTDQTYNNFSKRLIEKFNLRGKAGKDSSRQYGRIKAIKDIDKLKSYTLKDGNFRTNLESKDIEKAIEASFKKLNTQTLIDEIVETVLEYHKTCGLLNNTFMEQFEVPSYRFIIKQLINKNNKINKSLLKTILIRSIVQSDLDENLKTNKILSII